MNIVVLYGTESGNAELVADDISDALRDRVEVETRDMSAVRLQELVPEKFFLIVCSTHGDGELPSGAVPFAEALDSERPDLGGLRYGMFGLGDRSYDTYSRGSELIDVRLQGLGAERVGEYGRHDASSRDTASDLAILWAEGVLENIRERLEP